MRAETVAGATVAGATIALAGGGTAGHVNPGLEVARMLRAHGLRVFWLGTHGALEARLVRAAGIEFHALPAGKLRRYASLRNITDIGRTGAGVLGAVRILRRERAGVLFAKGGFVSVPPAAAAALLGIPVVTHESDSTAGLATKIISLVARRVLLSWPSSSATLPLPARARLTGLPVRTEMRAGDPGRGRRYLGVGDRTRIMLVVGGSLGAATLNHMVGEARAELTRDWMVVHQTGGQNGGQAVDDPGYRAQPYFDEEFPDVLAAADVVVSRAGATSLAEFAATGTAAVLVPLPRSSSRGEQIVNARLLADAGAALVLQPGAQTASGLVRCARRLADDRLRARMSAAIRSLDRPGATAEVVRHTLRAAGLALPGLQSRITE